jgi:hypothetical protein
MSDTAVEAPTTFDSTADALAELERRESARAEERKATKAAQSAPADDEPVAEEASADDIEEPGDEPEDEADDPDVVAEVATDEDAEEAAPLTVEFDGQKLEIPQGTPKALVEAAQKLASDLKADYTRKTQETAAERKSVEEAKAASAKAFAELQQAQMAVAQMAERMVGSPPPLELAQSDISAYTVQKAMYEQRLQVLQSLRDGQRGMTAKQQQEAEAARQTELAEEQSRLLKALPSLADDAKRQEFSRLASETVAQFGFSAQELAAVGDHRMLLMINRLAELEKADKARKTVAGTLRSKSAQTPPKTIQPGAANAPSTGQKSAKVKSEFMRGNRDMKSALRAMNALT